jgi:hypothetical protein
VGPQGGFSVDAVTRLWVVQVRVTEDSLEILLARWQKVLGLLGNTRVRRADIADVRVIEDPIREVMGTGLKAGLRIPWLYYVCRTIRLEQVFIVRRGVPALSFTVDDGSPLKRVIVSTGAAHELVHQLDSD